MLTQLERQMNSAPSEVLNQSALTDYNLFSAHSVSRLREPSAATR
jgi:hypothetical protein